MIVRRGLWATPAVLASTDAVTARHTPGSVILTSVGANMADIEAFQLPVPFPAPAVCHDIGRRRVGMCFRTMEGAEMFRRIRGYISTVRKQGKDMLGR